MLSVAHLDVDAERLAELVATFKAPAIAAAQRGDHYKRPAEREPHGRGVPWDLDYQANKIAPKVSENNLSAPSIGIIENHCNVKLDCNCAIHASGGTDAANGASPYYRYNLGDVNGDPEGLLKASLEAWERNPDPWPTKSHLTAPWSRWREKWSCHSRTTTRVSWESQPTRWQGEFSTRWTRRKCSYWLG